MRSGIAVLDSCLPGGVRRAVADHRRGGDAKVEDVDALVAGWLVGGGAYPGTRGGHITFRQSWRRSPPGLGAPGGHVPAQNNAARLVEPGPQGAAETDRLC